MAGSECSSSDPLLLVELVLLVLSSAPAAVAGSRRSTLPADSQRARSTRVVSSSSAELPAAPPAVCRAEGLLLSPLPAPARLFRVSCASLGKGLARCATFSGADSARCAACSRADSEAQRARMADTAERDRGLVLAWADAGRIAPLTN